MYKIFENSELIKNINTHKSLISYITGITLDGGLSYIFHLSRDSFVIFRDINKKDIVIVDWDRRHEFIKTIETKNYTPHREYILIGIVEYIKRANNINKILSV